MQARIKMVAGINLRRIGSVGVAEVAGLKDA